MNIEMIEGVHCPYKNSLEFNKEDAATANTDDIDLKIKALKIMEKRITIADVNGVSNKLLIFII